MKGDRWRAALRQAAARPTSVLVLVGLLLIVLQSLVAMVSHRFEYGMAPPGNAIPAFVSLQIAAGLLYVAVITSARRLRGAPAALPAIIIIGLLLRAVNWSSAPILEDDFYRYLWDGATVRAGVSPYRYSPAEVLRGEAPEKLRLAALSAGPVVARINHPDLATIYPPVAQACFALASALSPFSLNAWKGVLLLADLATLILLLRLLKSTGAPLVLVAVYWWNPLFIKETFNSAHMDVMLLPFLLGAMLLRIRERHAAAAVLLALATGVKIWPVLLAPLVFAPAVRRGGRALFVPLIYLALSAACLAPMFFGLRESSGVVQYAGRWEMNDGLFAALVWVGRITGTAGPATIRAMIVAAIAILALWVAVRDTGSPSGLVKSALWVTSVLLLVSPAQFPWYFTWIVPFLAAVPATPLLALTATLPMYYFRFHFAAVSRAGTFDDAIVFVEWLPIWALLVSALVRRRSRDRRELVEQC